MKLNQLIGKGPKAKGRKPKEQQQQPPAAQPTAKVEIETTTSSSSSEEGKHACIESAPLPAKYLDVSGVFLARLDAIDAKIDKKQYKTALSDLRSEVQQLKKHMHERDNQRAVAMAELSKKRALSVDELKISPWSAGDLKMLRAAPPPPKKKK